MTTSTQGPLVESTTPEASRVLGEALAAAKEALGTEGVQVFPGSYLIKDDAGTDIGAAWCEKVSPTKYNEYYGMTAYVGGSGTADGKVVLQMVWKDPFFADLAAFQAYCTTKGYDLHILATCVSGAW